MSLPPSLDVDVALLRRTATTVAGTGGLVSGSSGGWAGGGAGSAVGTVVAGATATGAAAVELAATVTALLRDGDGTWAAGVAARAAADAATDRDGQLSRSVAALADALRSAAAAYELVDEHAAKVVRPW